MSATGFGITKTQAIDYNCGHRQTENIYNYFVYVAACAEFEVDCLTSDHQVAQTRRHSEISAGDSRRPSIDIGDSMNLAVDIGQIKGAFLQGHGMMTMEELRC
jgi:xanthine dehydrogenase/oxidase